MTPRLRGVGRESTTGSGGSPGSGAGPRPPPGRPPSASGGASEVPVRRHRRSPSPPSAAPRPSSRSPRLGRRGILVRRRGGFGILLLEHGVRHQFLVHHVLQLESRHLQQLDGLLQRGRHDQPLRELEGELLFECHVAFRGISGGALARSATPVRAVWPQSSRNRLAEIDPPDLRVGRERPGEPVRKMVPALMM